MLARQHTPAFTTADVCDVPAGAAYKFMLWAHDFGKTGTDTFRIKIWYVDAGSEVVVYDNGFTQAIGGGNIVVQTR